MWEWFYGNASKSVKLFELDPFKLGPVQIRSLTDQYTCMISAIQIGSNCQNLQLLHAFFKPETAHRICRLHLRPSLCNLVKKTLNRSSYIIFWQNVVFRESCSTLVCSQLFLNFVKF